MEKIDVGCAIIGKERNLLIAQRYWEDDFGGYWEFPGGKKEKNETIKECLIREIKEELDIVIQPYKILYKSEHIYNNQKIFLFFYLCRFIEWEPKTKECHDFKWISKADLWNIKFVPGDESLLKELSEKWEECF